MTIGLDEQIVRQQAVIRHCEGKAGVDVESDKAILLSLRRLRRIEELIPAANEAMVALNMGLGQQEAKYDDAIKQAIKARDMLSAALLKQVEEEVK